MEGAYGRILRALAPNRYQRYSLKRTASRYDMRSEPSEDYYAGIYLHFIREDLGARFGGRKVKVLDVGCGQGRLSIPLARDGHTVTGLDISKDAIGKARAYAAAEGAEVRWVTGDLPALKAALPDELFDCILCTEVLYMVEDPDGFVRELKGWLREGGLLILSLRTRAYYLLAAVQRGDWHTASLVARELSGRLDGMLLHWHTGASTDAMLARLGLRSLRHRGIGILSGIPGDPFAAVCVPSSLDPEGREALRSLEIQLAGDYAEIGRYLYVAAEATPGKGA